MAVMMFIGLCHIIGNVSLIPSYFLMSKPADVELETLNTTLQTVSRTVFCLTIYLLFRRYVSAILLGLPKQIFGDTLSNFCCRLDVVPDTQPTSVRALKVNCQNTVTKNSTRVDEWNFIIHYSKSHGFKNEGYTISENGKYRRQH